MSNTPDLRPKSSDDAVAAGHETKTDVINRHYDVEHWPDGTHRAVTQEAEATPATPATDHGKLYVKLVGGVPELHYLDDTGAEVQLTTGGTVNAGALNTVKDNIALNAFRIAVNESLTQFAMIEGILDEFEDETSVDTGGSTNETYNATLDLYNNKGASEQAVAQGAGTAIGDMTENGGLAAAFDVRIETQTFANSAIVANGNAGNAGKDWGVGNTKLIDKFEAHSSKDEGFTEASTPTDCKLILEGSQNNSDWTTLFTSSNFTDNIDLVKTYTHASDVFVMTTAYRYHRVRITCGGSGVAVGYQELKFWEEATPLNMTLVSNAFTAEAEPTIARVVVFEEDGDTSTVNTDLKVYASRDGGTTYTQITLTDEGDYESGKRILSGQVSISAQPSGTSMKWKIETLNTKLQNYHGISLSWS